MSQEPDIDRTLNQGFVVPAACHILLWAAELVTPWGWHPHSTKCLLSWWVSAWERAPAWRENAFWSCVLDSSGQRCSRYSDAEWENEGIRGRPKADHRAQWNQGWDEQTNQPWVWANAGNWVLNQIGWQGKKDCSISLDNSSRMLRHFVEDFASFEWRSNSDPPNVEQRYL